MQNSFYSWLGEQDFNNLVWQHGEYQTVNQCQVWFDTFLYWLYRGADDKEMIGVPVEVEPIVKIRNSNLFNDVYPHIVELIESGITQVGDIASEAGVSHQAILSWIRRGKLYGEKRFSESHGRSIWHVML